MTTREALDEVIHRDTVDGATSVLVERGVWMADADTMSQAIHEDVLRHDGRPRPAKRHKDRDQARQLIAAIGRSIAIGAGAREG